MPNRTFNIHDRARQLVAQSPRPMTLSEAYSMINSRPRRSHGKLIVKRSTAAHLATVETPTGKDSWREIPQAVLPRAYRDDTFEE